MANEMTTVFAANPNKLDYIPLHLSHRSLASQLLLETAPTDVSHKAETPSRRIHIISILLEDGLRASETDGVDELKEEEVLRHRCRPRPVEFKLQQMQIL